MKGFLKMLASEFDAWNTTAIIAANANGVVCESYTFSTPDTDGVSVWARVEHDFIEGNIKTREEAIAAGMDISVEL